MERAPLEPRTHGQISQRPSAGTESGYRAPGYLCPPRHRAQELALRGQAGSDLSPEHQRLRRRLAGRLHLAGRSDIQGSRILWRCAAVLAVAFAIVITTLTRMCSQK